MAITRLINPARLENPKSLTRDEVAKRQERAINFARNVVEDQDLADQLADMSVEEYAAKKKFRLENPRHEKEKDMADRSERTSGLTEGEVSELRQIIRQSRGASAERASNPTRVSNPGRLSNQTPDAQDPSLSRTARLAKRLRTDRDSLVDALQEIADLLDAEDFDTASEIVDEVLCEYEDEEE